LLCIIKDGLSLEIKKNNIHHLYVIATKYSRINALVEYNINYIPKSFKIIFDESVIKDF